MHKLLPAILLLLTVPAIALSAQTINGMVVEDETGVPIAGAMVMLKKADAAIAQYAITNEDGRFCLEYAIKDCGSCFLEVRMMGYRTEVIRPPFQDSITVRMTVEKFKLNAVVVEAEKVEVHGDTISYSVPAILSNDDRVLGDILVKLPGLEVDNSGFVRYQGQPVSRMYIEGSDLLGSRYNIATQNIDSRDISSIQVYERHQPVRALEGLVETDKAALNITLKPGSRSKWIATLQAEAGGSSEKPHVPYSGSGFLMNIGRKFQTINTIKTDAAGNSIIRNQEVSTPGIVVIDLNDIDFANRYRAKDYLNISFPSAPIDARRTRFNTSYSMSTDNKIALARGFTLGVYGDYENNALSSMASTEQTYLNEDGTQLTYFKDENRGVSNSWYGSAAIKLNTNTERLYLNDHLRFKISGNRASNSIGGTSSHQERTDGRNLEIANSLNLISRTSGTSAISLSMLSQYAENSGALRVTDSENADTATQYINTRFFFNTVYFSTRQRLGQYLSLHSLTDLKFLWRDFRTNLNGVRTMDWTDAISDRTSNNLNFFYIKPHEQLTLSLSFRNFSASLSVDAWYQFIRKEHRWAVNPGLNLKYTFGSRLWATASASYGLTPIDEQSVYDGVILQNYRYLTLGRKELTGVPSLHTACGLNFRDPVSGWYFRGHASYTRSNTFESSRYIVGEYIIQQQSDSRVPYRNVNTGVKVEKSFLDIAGKLYMEADFNILETSIHQNGEFIDYTGYTAETSAGFSGDITRWLKLKYDGTYRYSRYMIEERWSEDATHSFQQSLTLSFFPFEKVELDISGEHYTDKYQEQKFRQTIFLDVSAWYFITDKVQIFLHAKNLLNQKYYTYSHISPLCTSIFSYKIRPLNILIGFQVKL